MPLVSGRAATSRLYRGRWQVEAHFADHDALEPRDLSLTYEDAARLIPALGEEGAKSAILHRVRDTRAPWESRACFEASDPPVW